MTKSASPIYTDSMERVQKVNTYMSYWTSTFQSFPLSLSKDCVAKYRIFFLAICRDYSEGRGGGGV